MIAWLHIDSTPALELWRESAARDHLTADLTYRRLIDVGPVQRPAAVGGGAEAANVSVQLDNGDGLLSELLAVPPLRRAATVYQLEGGAPAVLFTGFVADIELGATATITIEA